MVVGRRAEEWRWGPCVRVGGRVLGPAADGWKDGLDPGEKAWASSSGASITDLRSLWRPVPAPAASNSSTPTSPAVKCKRALRPGWRAASAGAWRSALALRLTAGHRSGGRGEAGLSARGTSQLSSSPPAHIRSAWSALSAQLCFIPLGSPNVLNISNVNITLFRGC